MHRRPERLCCVRADVAIGSNQLDGGTKRPHVVALVRLIHIAVDVGPGRHHIAVTCGELVIRDEVAVTGVGVLEVALAAVPLGDGSLAVEKRTARQIQQAVPEIVGPCARVSLVLHRDIERCAGEADLEIGVIRLGLGNKDLQLIDHQVEARSWGSLDWRG